MLFFFNQEVTTRSLVLQKFVEVTLQEDVTSQMRRILDKRRSVRP